MSQIYYDDWEEEGWDGVSLDFLNNRYNDFGNRLDEPEEVILASYQCQNEYHEGYAWVVFRNGDKFYEVCGYHNSCCGLEGQWDPEEYADAMIFLRCLEKKNWENQERGIYLRQVIERVNAYLRK